MNDMQLLTASITGDTVIYCSAYDTVTAFDFAPPKSVPSKWKGAGHGVLQKDFFRNKKSRAFSILIWRPWVHLFRLLLDRRVPCQELE